MMIINYPPIIKIIRYYATEQWNGQEWGMLGIRELH